MQPRFTHGTLKRMRPRLSTVLQAGEQNSTKVAILMLLAAYAVACAAAPATLAGPHDPRLQVLARFDDSSPDRLRFGYPGSGLKLRYSGAPPLLDIASDTDTAALTLVLDDAEPILAVLHKGRQNVSTPAPDARFADRPHILTVFKRTETWQGVVTFFGLLSTGVTELLPAPSLPARRLLFVGDSVTCGSGVARDDACTNNPDHPNTDIYNSYGMILARRLDAQAELVCYGGRGVLRDYRGLGAADGILNASDFVPLSIPADDPKQRAPWNEQRSIPDLVFVSLGTNDFSLQKKQPLDPEKFVSTYAALLKHLLATYPHAQVIASGGAITTDPLLQQYISRAVSRIAEPRLTVVASTHYPGNSCDAHPTAAQHKRMADDIEPEIRSRLHW